MSTTTLNSEEQPPRRRPRKPFLLGAPRPLVAPMEGLLDLARLLAGADRATVFALEGSDVTPIATVGSSTPPPTRLAMRALAVGSHLIEVDEGRFTLALPMAACGRQDDERRRFRPRSSVASACLVLEGPGTPPEEPLSDAIAEKLIAAFLGAIESRSFADSVATDFATGALNRAAFERAAMLELGLCRSAGRPAALLLVEVLPRDSSVEADTANEAIALAARAARHALRADDLIGRRGPDELSALLVDASVEHLHATAERILQRVRLATQPLGLPAPLVGAAAFPTHAGTLQDLDDLALDALERARTNGPGSVRLFNPEFGPSSTAARKSYFTGDPWLDARKSSLLFESVLAANGARGVADVLAAVLHAVLTATSADRAVVLTGSGRDLEVAAALDHRLRQIDPPLRISRTACLRALALGRATFVVDTRDPGADVGQSALDLSLRSVVTVPLLARDGPIGVIYADSVRPSTNPYTPEDLAYLEALAAQAALALENATLRDRLQAENTDLRRVASSAASDQDPILGASPALRTALRHLPEIIESASSVLILGESGTGKELVARSLHRRGPRSQASFVPQNCAAIPADLLESELFGHAEGAFSGATRAKRGLLELAEGGTFFLDEVADLPLALQSKLLRVLEDKEVRRIGETQGRRFDFRLICATNRDLEQEVVEGRFRRDLFHRINVFTLRLPALRDRREDIVPLAEHFAMRVASGLGQRIPRFTPAALDALGAAPWPGNVRELANVVERAVTIAHGGDIEPAHLEMHNGAMSAAKGPLRELLAQVERDAITNALQTNDGNVAGAARTLGIARQQLQRLIQKHRLSPKSVR